MKNLGVMEIFYGKPWSESDRLAFAPLLKTLGMGFYLYGPKGDAALRKNWRTPLSAPELASYAKTREAFQANGIPFGIILSPLGLHEGFDLAAKSELQGKINQLCELNLDYLGLFFDDMPSAPDLAKRQIDLVSSVSLPSKTNLIFCPTFYTYDPILEMLFGERPPNYLKTLGQEIPQNVEILWTGESVISQNISRAHLADVTELLKRKPFLCDNFYANDGPIFSNFLKLIAPTGRERDVFTHASHWAFNPMNQAPLSRIVLSAIHGFTALDRDPEQAIVDAITQAVSPELGEFILTHAASFANAGLDELDEATKDGLIQKLAKFQSQPAAIEILLWLKGDYAFSLEDMNSAI